MQEKSGSWQLPCPRDCVCVPELLTAERKKYTWKGKQTAPGMAAPRFHGDAGCGRGPLDQAAVSNQGRAFAVAQSLGREHTKCLGPRPWWLGSPALGRSFSSPWSSQRVWEGGGGASAFLCPAPLLPFSVLHVVAVYPQMLTPVPRPGNPQPTSCSQG